MSRTRCKKCVISKDFPGIRFDDDGVCTFCKGEAIASTQASAVEDARAQLEELLSQKNGAGEYDAIMCYSGGKDSTYTLKLAVEKYHMRVLSFTLDNGFISSTAHDNIRRVVEKLSIDHLSVSPSRKVFNKIIEAVTFNRVFNPGTLRRISSGCNACISIVNNTALQIALEKRVPIILAGFTIGQIPANSIIYQNNYSFMKESRERSLNLIEALVGEEAMRYLSIPENLITEDVRYPHTVNLLCLENINEEEIIKNVEGIGWKAPSDVDGCSSNCQLNVFNNYVHEKLYGYSPYELEMSHLIRGGLLSRQQALEKLKDQPKELFESVADRLNISEEQLKKIDL